MLWLSYFWGALWLWVASSVARPFLDSWLSELDEAERPWLIWPLTFGLSIGGVTLLVFVVGLWQLNGYTVLGVLIVLLGAGVWNARGFKITHEPPDIFVRTVWHKIWQGDLNVWLWLVLGSVFVIVLGQATYYPFIGDDEISRYAYYAKLMWWQGQVTTDIRGYPMLMPVAYASIFALTNTVYQSTGQVAEQLARVIPVLFSAATVLATAVLGQHWFGRSGGLTAALLLICTPLYLHWSADGYVDIPSALYFVLGAYAADVWLKARTTKWVLLTGVLTGLALWTKQAGFAMLPALGLIFGWAVIQDRRLKSAAIRDGVWILLAAFVCGGWWYARNIYYEGWLNFAPTPGTFYTQQARATWPMLIPFLGAPADFGVAASAFYLIGLGWALFRLKRTGVLWLLAWCAPYTLLWWQSYSYDARFLLTVLPFYALFVGGLIAEVSNWWGAHGGVPVKWGVLIAISCAAVLSISETGLGGARQWLVAPTLSYGERLTRAKGDLYPTIEFIQRYIPAEARLVSIDGRLPYYFMDRQVAVFYPASFKELAAYDYFVQGSWWVITYDLYGLSYWEMIRLINDRRVLQPVFTGPTSSLIVYRVMKP